MTSYDRHASHDSPYRTGQHMPLNQSRHAPLTSVATSAMESRADLNTFSPDESRSSMIFQNGNGAWPNTPGMTQTPTSPYSPGMRSTFAMQKQPSAEPNPFDQVTPGEIQMQSFQDGLPPPPPVTHSWKRIDRWAEEYYEELYDQLSEGCTQNDVNELEHELDCSLPMEVRESLQYHDGQERGGRPTGIIFGCMLLDCEEIVQEWKNWRTVNEEYLTAPVHLHIQTPGKAFGGSSAASNSTPQPSANPLWRQDLIDKQDSQPPRAIQKAYAHPGWIPLARDWGGNNIAVDLAPGPMGKWGQIIVFGRDYDCKYVVARSWAAFVATVADDLASGKVFVDEETQELKLKEFKTSSVEPAYLDILRWRMDQKYGRRPPKRKPTNGLGPQSPTNGGSPYGSPPEDRGRSPHRYPSRGAPNPSPRGAMGKSSPLAKVSEEAQSSVSVGIGAQPNKEMLRLETAVNNESTGALLDAATPAADGQSRTRKDLGAVMEPVVLNDDHDKENRKDPMVKGLGVEGLDEMKSVDI
ncbi:Cell wall assembly regulator [Loxospora ochrophaea]|nr:Cell wall assembly regulator [Loxospora ochrophaea]